MAEQKKTMFSNTYSVYTGAKQKRKIARVKLDIPCLVQIADSNSSLTTGRLSDLGTGGLSLQSNSIFYTGDVVRVNFSLDRKPAEISGTIQRTAGKSVGVVFGELPQELHGSIQEFIHKHYFEPKLKSQD